MGRADEAAEDSSTGGIGTSLREGRVVADFQASTHTSENDADLPFIIVLLTHVKRKLDKQTTSPMRTGPDSGGLNPPAFGNFCSFREPLLMD